MKLDFLICASPTSGLLSQIAFFRFCLNALGGDYAKARLVAVLGDHETEAIPAQWRRYLDNIEVEWAHETGASNDGHRAQHDRRFEVIRDDADLALICDADVAILKPLDSLLAELTHRPALAGVIAHDHFPKMPETGNVHIGWEELSQDIIGKKIATPYHYTLHPDDPAKRAPFYINYGMLAGPPSLLKAFYARDLQLRDAIAERVGHYWAPQISVALACADLSLPTLALPMRYNFPNDPVADALYPEEMENIVFLHYLRRGYFRREKIFARRLHFRKFIKSRLSGSNEYFRQHVQDITDGKYPFPRYRLG